MVYCVNGAMIMLDADTQERVALRLRRIEGQVRGLERTVKGSQFCVDLLTQIAAIQAALKSAGDEVLHHHLRYCVGDSVGRRLRPVERAWLEEMAKIFTQYCKDPSGIRRSSKNSRE